MKPRARPDALDLDALASKLAPLVVARLAGALGAIAAPYSTRRGHEPPEYQGRSKKWKADAPTIPGAVRVGRWWSVPRDRYAAWIAAQSSVAPAPAPAATSSRPWSPADELGSLGLRPSH